MCTFTTKELYRLRSLIVKGIKSENKEDNVDDIKLLEKFEAIILENRKDK